MCVCVCVCVCGCDLPSPPRASEVGNLICFRFVGLHRVDADIALQIAEDACVKEVPLRRSKLNKVIHTSNDLAGGRRRRRRRQQRMDEHERIMNATT